MVGIQALLAHNFRGYGPGIPAVEPLMLQWSRADAENKSAVIGEYCKAQQEEVREEEEKSSGNDLILDDKDDTRLASLRTSASLIVSGRYKGPRVVAASEEEASSSSSSSSSSKVSKASGGGGDVESQAKSIVQELESSEGGAEMKQILIRASNLDVTIDVLRDTGIGKVIKRAGKRAVDVECKDLVEEIVAKWKAKFSA
jgi:hypothetical protein